MQLPSALTLTAASEVVGETQALKPIAMPRPFLHRPVPSIQGVFQSMRVSRTFEHLFQRRVLHHRAGRLRPALAQQVPAPELDRVDAELARHQVGVALVRPDQLRDAEAAQRAGRRQVGVERIRIHRHVLDVVRTGRGEARFLRYAGADVGVGAAVPPYLAFARGDLAVLRYAALDPERAGVLGDGEELLFHGQGDLHRALRQEG
jgi:hypothetical protein